MSDERSITSTSGNPDEDQVHATPIHSEGFMKVISGGLDVAETIDGYLQYEKHPFFIVVSNYSDRTFFLIMDQNSGVNTKKVNVVSYPPMIPSGSERVLIFNREEFDENQKEEFSLQFNAFGSHNVYFFVGFKTGKDDDDDDGLWTARFNQAPPESGPNFTIGYLNLPGHPDAYIFRAAVPTANRGAKFNLAISNYKKKPV